MRISDWSSDVCSSDLMVYDTLFAMDAKGEPQPQMVDSYQASEDKKKWTFVLRDGLKFSDGQPVKTADCVASMQRWTARDNIGHALSAAGGQWQAVEDKTLPLTPERPFGLVLDSLAKVPSYAALSTTDQDRGGKKKN